MTCLSWIKCEQGIWCSLGSLDLEIPYFIGLSGVYIIWVGATSKVVLRVGQGAIAQRLDAHRRDPAIRSYLKYSPCVTWAQVEPALIDGVEAYLGSVLNPIESQRFPDIIPINVILPWTFP